MKRLMLVTAALAAAALLMFACDQGGDHGGGGGGGGGSGDMFPLGIGSTWVYAVTQRVSNPDTTVHFDWTWKAVATDTLQSGLPAVALERLMSGGGAYVETTWYRKESTCVLEYYDLSTTYPDTFLLLPLDQGKSWNYGGTQMTVTGKQDITVPAGTFSGCWKVSMYQSSPGDTLSFWFGGGKGLVQYYFAHHDSAYSSTAMSELKSVTIKP